MQNPNVPRHDDISVKLDIGVLSDISYPLISIPVRWKSWNLSKFYVPDYRIISKIYPWLWLVLHITYIALS